jgi:hypothetical protein
VHGQAHILQELGDGGAFVERGKRERAGTRLGCLFVITVLLALAALFGIGLHRVVQSIIR